MLLRLRELFKADKRASDDWQRLDALARTALQNGELESAVDLYGQLIDSKPRYAEARYKRANALSRLGRLDAALADYDQSIALDPAHARAFCNRGAVLEQLGRWQESLASYDRAIALDCSDFLTHYNRGSALKQLERFDEALASYDRAIALNSDFVAAHINRGNVLLELNRQAGAIESYDRAIAMEPRHAEAFHGRGLALSTLKRFEEAVVEYERAIELRPSYTEAHHGLGLALANLKRFDRAIASVDRALALDPDKKFLLGTSCATKMQACRWDDFDSDLKLIARGVQFGKALCSPMTFAALLDFPELHRAAAESWIREQAPPDAALGTIPGRQRSGRIRIGYFSADFGAHPVSLLAAGLFASHDRTKFEVTAFAFGPEAHDAVRARLVRAFDRFEDVRERSDREVAALARERGIDIAVDLNGFTEYCRTKIFALRAAPIQVNYLGYPGTMGAKYIDYIVADRVLIPRAHQDHYAEKIIYLPDSFIPFDSSYAIADKTFTRQELGLPSDSFVFCCFNNAFKITPAIFDSWMRILGRTENSVLWLSHANSTAAANLRNEASRRGIDPHRLIFAERWASLPEHLARLRVADLFLDTLPYNAHATAIDALWAGLPLLTLAGHGFAARVAASLLRTAGLTQLITESSAQYEDSAVELATDPTRLAELRVLFAQSRATAALFDTERYTRNLEAAFQRIYDQYHSGAPPCHINEHLAT